MNGFSIEAYGFEWICGDRDDPNDLCLHGRARVRFGDTVLEDSGTISAAALLMMRTAAEDKVMAEYDIQMVPCCGHTMFANDDLTRVEISGCDKGLDWTTLHNGEELRLILPNGKETRVSRAEYRAEALKLARQVKAFYDSCTPKVMPENEIDRDGYIAFWNEWNSRYESLCREEQEDSK